MVELSDHCMVVPCTQLVRLCVAESLQALYSHPIPKDHYVILRREQLLKEKKGEM